MIVGIDLSTTKSLIGIYRDGAPQLFPNPTGSLLTPSAVSIADDGSVLVGSAARDRLLTHPERSVAHLKRWMGSPRETPLKGRNLRAEQLSALVLRSLISDAEAATGETVTEAVISVPVWFSDTQHRATRLAGPMAGITVERLITGRPRPPLPTACGIAPARAGSWCSTSAAARSTCRSSRCSRASSRCMPARATPFSAGRTFSKH